MQRHPGALGGADDDGDVGYVRSLLSSDSLCQQYVSPCIVYLPTLSFLHQLNCQRENWKLIILR